MIKAFVIFVGDKSSPEEEVDEAINAIASRLPLFSKFVLSHPMQVGQLARWATGRQGRKLEDSAIWEERQDRSDREA